MAPERENTSLPEYGTLQMKSYAIDGNDIRAYYDAADELVFVIDDTVAGNKSNALLVINPVGNRKWDDILANDYGVVLENIRPKKDNKYQKLDIEYIGLDVYKDLIRDFENGVATDNALRALASFRVTAARRSAQARLTAALAVAETTRETIVKTNDTIADLRARVKELRTKLSRQKKSVGKEPTKQSAAKILRTESQIDATNEKLQRAERRIRNAQRRLLVAEDDAAAARAILDTTAGVPMTAPVHDVATVKDSLPAAAPKAGPVVAATPAPAVQDAPMMSMPTFVDIDLGDDDGADVAEFEAAAPVQQLIEEDKITLLPEPKAENMAEEEVKPLFDKDPEILDEEIAFKPIDFGTVSIPQSADNGLETMPSFAEPASPAAPLSFAPPSGTARAMDSFADATPAASMQSPSSVLDTITPVDAGAASSEYLSDPVAATPQMDAPYQPAAAMPTDNMAERPAPISAPVPGAAAAPARPVSPVGGAPVRPVSGGGDGHRPNFLYYAMLIVLIVLSIFTLWLYQRNTKDTTPDLATTSNSVEKPAPAPAMESPFIAQEEVATVATVAEPEPTPAPVEEPEEPAPVAPVVEPEPTAAPIPEPEPAPEPVIDDTAPEIPVVAQPEPAPVPQEPDTPFLSEPAPEPEPEQSVLINKPVYNAGGQHDDMFVASEDYETDVVAMPDTMIESAQPMDMSDNGLVCDDGTMPDGNGCCGGEAFTDMGDGFACCSSVTGDCYPPMF